jgi:hypothetical protein
VGQGRVTRLSLLHFSGIAGRASLAVDGAGESAYVRGSFDMFEVSSAGIALARADRTFCRLQSSHRADCRGIGHENE